MPAEHNIDKVVHEKFFSKMSEPGVAIEVGAAHPDYLSIGAHFRKLGWRVIAIEPNPEFCKMHQDRGNEVYQYACSDHDADDAEFYVVNSFGREYMGGNVTYESFSSLGIRGKSAELYSHHKDVETSTIRVNVRTLDHILESHCPGVSHIDLLAVDVEGWELEVVKGFNLEKYTPRVIILENLFDDRAYGALMESKGYRWWNTLFPNEIFIKT